MFTKLNKIKHQNKLLLFSIIGKQRSVNMLYWSRPSSIIVMILVFQVACFLFSPSVLVYLYYRDHVCTGNNRKTIIGKHALLVQSRLHYCDDSCFTSCLFADFTKCPCVTLLQRSCCTGNSRKTMIGKHALLVQSRLHYCDDSCFTSCLFADFTQCPCVPLLQRNKWKT